jgi:hypothetical protein
VTVWYQTPNSIDINKVGIQPDLPLDSDALAPGGSQCVLCAAFGYNSTAVQVIRFFSEDLDAWGATVAMLVRIYRVSVV